MSIELAKVVNDAVVFRWILSSLDLCKNLISCLFSLGVFSCDLSKASIDFGVGCEGLNLIGRKFATELGEKIVLILETNLSKEGAEVVKVLSSGCGFFLGSNLGEDIIFSFTSKIGV